MSLFNHSYKFYDNIFNVTYYRKYVIKRHIDIPKDEEQSSTIMVMVNPKYLPEYKNYPYFKATYLIPHPVEGYCVGYKVTTIPDIYGCTEKFMPIYSQISGKERIRMNLQFKEKYKKYLKKFEIKRMWKILFTLMSAKILAKIGFGHNLFQINSCIPLELAHTIYQFSG